MQNFDILIQGVWSSSQVTMHFPERHCPDSTFQPPAGLQHHIKNTWEKLQSKHPHIFNGEMARLSEWSEDDGLNLVLHRTDYRTYLGTRAPDLSGVRSKADRANPLGINIIVLTSDNYAVLSIRSLSADQNPGCLFFIGGYVDTPSKGTTTVKKEVAREVQEELGICPEEILSVEVHGLCYDPVFCHPELFTLVKVGSTAQDVRSLYFGAKDRHEAESLHLVEAEKVRAASFARQEKTCWSFDVGRYLWRESLAKSDD